MLPLDYLGAISLSVNVRTNFLQIVWRRWREGKGFLCSVELNVVWNIVQLYMLNFNVVQCSTLCSKVEFKYGVSDDIINWSCRMFSDSWEGVAQLNFINIFRNFKILKILNIKIKFPCLNKPRRFDTQFTPLHPVVNPKVMFT